MSSDSQWFSLRGLTSFHFWQDQSLGVTSSSAVSSSSCLGIYTPWSDEWHCHFMPVRDAGISDTLGMEAADVSSLPATACGWVVANIPKVAASGTLSVRSCKGYISAPWVLGRQAHRDTPEASTKVQWSCPSSAFVSCSSARTLSLWVCCKTQAVVVWHISASLNLAVWCTLASLIEVVWCTLATFIEGVWFTSASLIAVTWPVSASLIASMAWASFMHMVSLVLSSSSLWQESIVALVVSSHSRAMFICPCSQSTLSGSLAGPTLGETWAMGWGRCWPPPVFSPQLAGMVTDWCEQYWGCLLA